MTPKSIAIMSGKGGTGKTMIAAFIPKLRNYYGKTTVLIDADVGTAGLTFYLGLKSIAKVSLGWTSALSDVSAKLTQPILGQDHSFFVGVGDHRYARSCDGVDWTIIIDSILREVTEKIGANEILLIFDCRGGIDEQAVSLIRNIDEVVLVAEPDSTSYQATRHLVEVLSENGMQQKLSGFVLNKVFDDPSTVVRHGTMDFASRFLGAIPFDLSAAREFLVGNVPLTDSVFGRHCHGVLANLLTECEPPSARLWALDDYRLLGTEDVDEQAGGRLLGFLILILMAIAIMVQVGLPTESQGGASTITISTVVGLAFCGLAVSSARTRRGVGAFARGYVKLLARLRRFFWPSNVS